MHCAYFVLESMQLFTDWLCTWSCDCHVELCHVQPPLLGPSQEGLGMEVVIAIVLPVHKTYAGPHTGILLHL